MKNKLSKVLIILILILSFSSCSNRNYEVALNNNSKVVVTFGDVNLNNNWKIEKWIIIMNNLFGC